LQLRWPSAAPLDRPQQLADKPPALVFPTGTYSQNWVPTRYFERRTLIEDPADGRLPPLTPEAVARRTARAQPPRARSASDLLLTDRCITYGVPDLFAAYMSVYRIFQTADHVAITMEKIHDTRIIPLDGRQEAAAGVTR
jgi:hypothetical protein